MAIWHGYYLTMIVHLMICAGCVLRLTFAYNFVTTLPLVKIGNNNTLFGHSVSFHIIAGSGPRIIVGAPKDTFFDDPTISNVPLPGRTYVCDLLEDYGCSKRLESRSLLDEMDISINNSLNGFSVCGSDVEGGPLISCAPHVRDDRNKYMGPGSCLVFKNDLVYSNHFGYCRQKEPYFDMFGLCHLGFSCALSHDLGFFGAPGAMTWRGDLSRVQCADSFEVDPKEATIRNIKDQKITQTYSYLGYSVATGIMDGEQVYASGAPREDYIGHVLLFHFNKQDHLLDLKTRLVGEQFGSYFGSSLCLADVNGDGELDLIVGAPFYHEPLVGGAIYVYIKKKGKFLQFEEPQKIKSRPMKEAECLRLNCFDGRFGWSITSLKDIDFDGYQDIAVGAPFEGRGVVYIFRGSKDGLVPKYSQRIESEEMSVTDKPLPSPFGYSLDSRGVDTDGNNYPDLVVGSFQSGSVHLLRTSSVVNVDVSFQNIPSILDPTLSKCSIDGQPRNCFQVRVCLRTGSRQYKLSATSIILNLTMETEVYAGAQLSRVYFEGKSQVDGYVIRKQVALDLTSHVEVCNNYKLYVASNVRDFLNPIPIRLSYAVDSKFPQFAGNKFLSIQDKTILNGSVGITEIMVDFQKNCGNDNMCMSELVLTSELLLQKTSTDTYKLLLGLDKEVVVAVEVQNLDEDAHEANVFIEYPDTLKYMGTNETKDGDDQKVVSCSHSTIIGVIVCSIGNPLASQGKVNFKVRFDPKGLTITNEFLPIKVSTNTTSNETNFENNLRTMKIEVMIESDLWVSGNSEPENVFFSGEVVGESGMSTEEDIGLEVRHSYEVKNIGLARVPSSTLVISWPYELQSEHPSGKHILYLLDPPLVEGIGECHFNNSMVDPLKLKKPALENLQKLNPLYSKVSPEEKSSTRRKREIGGIDTVLDCDKKTAKCHVFSCTIGELRPGQSVVVRLRARLWNSTFLTEFLKKEVAIQSKGQIVIKNDLITQTSLDNDVFKVVTFALSELRDVAHVPLWIIIVSVIAGILLLALIVFLLAKFGFFRRKKALAGVNTHRAVLTKEVS